MTAYKGCTVAVFTATGTDVLSGFGLKLNIKREKQQTSSSCGKMNKRGKKHYVESLNGPV